MGRHREAWRDLSTGARVPGRVRHMRASVRGSRTNLAVVVVMELQRATTSACTGAKAMALCVRVVRVAWVVGGVLGGAGGAVVFITAPGVMAVTMWGTAARVATVTVMVVMWGIVTSATITLMMQRCRTATMRVLTMGVTMGAMSVGVTAMIVVIVIVVPTVTTMTVGVAAMIVTMAMAMTMTMTGMIVAVAMWVPIVTTPPIDDGASSAMLMR